MNHPNRRGPAVSLFQASQASPSLARLTELTRDSTLRLQTVLPLIPATLRSGITAGPIDGSTWCLLVNNPAVAAKLRQLVPALQSALRNKGWEVTAIRIKVQSHPVA